MDFRAWAWAGTTATTLLLAQAALAQQPPPSVGNFYAGLAYGQSRAKDACSGVAGCRNEDDAFGAFAGYWLQRSLAIEGGYHNLGNVSAPGGSYIRSSVWELVVLAPFRPASSLALYTKIGVFRGAQEGGGTFAAPKERINGLTFAAGAQLDLTRRFGVRAEWQKYPRMGGGPVLPRGDVDVLRAAAVLRF